MTMPVSAAPRAVNENAESLATKVLLPETCTGCGAAWEGDCARCGLSRADAAALLAQACAAFALARAEAQAGRFAGAQAHLEAARAGGLGFHPAVRRLSELCDAVTGKSVGEAVRGEYAAAQAAARRGAWFEAAMRAEQCVLAVPALLPAQKLRVLCLAALGREGEAEHARRALLREVPGEPNVLRWQFMSPCRPRLVSRRSAPAVRRLPRLPAPEPASLPRREWVAVGGAAFGFAALLVSAVTALRPVPPVVASLPTPAPPPPPPAASPSPLALAPDLQREYGDSQKASVEQQARRWLNEAVGAFHRREWARAERLAAAALEVGPKTYLAEDALLLRAKAADNQNQRRAVALYEQLADRWPRSTYAPAALALALQAAQRLGDARQADQVRARLQTQYPHSAQAQRLQAQRLKV